MNVVWPRWVTSPHLMMLFMVLIFSVNVIVGRVAVGHVPPFTLGFVRWCAASLLLLPFAWVYLRPDAPQIGAAWKRLVLCGVAMPLVGAGLTYVALTRTVAINAGIIQTALPLFTVVTAWLVLGTRVSLGQSLGMAVATIGVVAIVLRGQPASLVDLTFNSGDLIMLVANAGLAVYAVTLKGMPGRMNRLSLLIVVFVIGAVVHAPLAIAELLDGATLTFSITAVLVLLFVAVFPSVAAIMLWNYGIERLGPGRAGVYMYLNGVFTAVLAFALLGEPLHGYHILGTVLIVLGVWYSERKAAG